MFKQRIKSLLVLVTSTLHWFWRVYVQTEALGGLCTCVLALKTSVFWRGLLSQSWSDCLQLLPDRSWRGELRRILTSFYHQSFTRRHARANARPEYPPAKSTIVERRQERPREPSSQMCPLALMADWRRKTPWRIRHLHSLLASSGDKQILPSLAKPSTPTHTHTHTFENKY